MAAQLRRPGRRRDLRQLRPADARRQGQGRVQPGLLRPDHRQLQPVLDGRSRVGQPHLAHHRSARRPVPAAHARGRGAARGGRARAVEARAARPMAPRTGRCRSAASRTARRAPAPTTTATSRSSSRRDTTVLLQEMIHDARVVPMTAEPHLPAHIRQLHGDPRGRWDGDTLVVETTNYINGFQGSTPDVKLTERYTRVSPDFINWEITVERSGDVDQAVHVHDPAEEDRRADLRIRLPRRQLRDGGHPRRRPRRGGQGQTPMSRR